MIVNIPYKDKSIVAEINSHEKKPVKRQNWIVLTHGAGGDMNNPQLVALSNFLANLNYIVLRFTCKGLNIKYRIKVLNAVVNYIDETYEPKGIIIGGRSMGARAAVMLCSDPEVQANTDLFNKIAAVICLSYPLHKTKDTSERRDQPLKMLQKPIFLLSGTKDEMCNKELLESVLHRSKLNYEIYWLENCDHSAKPKENYNEDMYCQAFESLSTWCSNVFER